MNCENEFCVYQKQDKCLLKNIEVNAYGSCISCILINIPQTTLNKLKSKTLSDIENRNE